MIYPSGAVEDKTDDISSNGTMNFTQDIWDVPDGFLTFVVECDGYAKRNLYFYKYQAHTRTR